MVRGDEARRGCRRRSEVRPSLRAIIDPLRRLERRPSPPEPQPEPQPQPQPQPQPGPQGPPPPQQPPPPSPPPHPLRPPQPAPQRRSPPRPHHQHPPKPHLSPPKHRQPTSSPPPHPQPRQPPPLARLRQRGRSRPATIVQARGRSAIPSAKRWRKGRAWRSPACKCNDRDKRRRFN